MVIGWGMGWFGNVMMLCVWLGMCFCSLCCVWEVCDDFFYVVWCLLLWCGVVCFLGVIVVCFCV